jgi:hypothetical protein
LWKGFRRKASGRQTGGRETSGYCARGGHATRQSTRRKSLRHCSGCWREVEGLSQSGCNFILRDFCACDFVDSVTDVKCFITPCSEVVWVDESIWCHKFTAVILKFSAALHT